MDGMAGAPVLFHPRLRVFGTWAAEFKVQRREKPEWDRKTSSLGPHRDFKGGNIENPG